MVKRMLTLSVVLAFSLVLGCSSTYPKWTTMKFMAGGAVVGGTVGGICGAEGYWGLGNAGEGVLVGSAIGATVGGLVGNIIEERDIKAEMDRLKAEIDRLTAENAALKSENDSLKKKIAELEARIKDLEEQLRNANVRALEISLGADVLFKPGSARLSDAGKAALDRAAGQIKSEYAGKFVMVEGHTDADPISISGWKSNWELGAARALTVLHYLADKGLEPANMSAATFSKYQPVADNSTKDGKAKNRRAVIVIYKNWNKPKVAQ